MLYRYLFRKLIKVTLYWWSVVTLRRWWGYGMCTCWGEFCSFAWREVFCEGTLIQGKILWFQVSIWKFVPGPIFLVLKHPKEVLAWYMIVLPVPTSTWWHACGDTKIYPVCFVLAMYFKHPNLPIDIMYVIILENLLLDALRCKQCRIVDLGRPCRYAGTTEGLYVLYREVCLKFIIVVKRWNKFFNNFAC